ncbi:class A beta-lactamase-related serine hydrolase [Nakamurella antarctica]|uniref:Class A beta-lactamase-related serine hydrolase n=2 Tax=Nakamurella antarctica TaxID=1902245 RepID=A0A3G8ZRC4_9ACTN|nr:class A beta-lactamase-related serine hydrolase [Nakamurella antarctica]
MRGVSPGRGLADVVTYFESWLNFRQRYLQIPGIQAAVLDSGELLLDVAFGSASLDDSDSGGPAGVALTPAHLFRVASHSKTFTATAVLQLVAGGTLALDDPASRWLPSLTSAASPIAGVTVRELLAHQGGVIRDGRNGDYWQLVGEFLDEAALLVESADPGADVFEPNVEFKYSNIGYSLLGLIIEAASGQTYADYVQCNIIDRLHLPNTGPEFAPDRAADYAAGHSSLAYSPHRVRIDHVDTRAMAAATGFYSTAGDLVNYFAAHAIGDDRLLDDRHKRMMQQPVSTVVGTKSQYGLGLEIENIGDRTLIGHGGGYPGHITRSLTDTATGLAVSVLTNCIDGPAEQCVRAFFTLLDLAESLSTPDVVAVDLSRFTGRYVHLWGVLDLVLLGGRLYAINPVNVDPATDAALLEVVDSATLKIIGGSGFGARGELMKFEFGDDGSVTRVRGASGMTLVPEAVFELPEQVRARKR